MSLSNRIFLYYLYMQMILGNIRQLILVRLTLDLGEKEGILLASQLQPGDQVALLGGQTIDC